MKLTINQQRVLVTLRQSDSPLSAYALLDKLREYGLTAPTQVYRALKRLETYGLVRNDAKGNLVIPPFLAIARSRHAMRPWPTAVLG